MSIRPSACQWLAVQHHVHSGAICTSKFYLSEKSWTKQDAWWLRIASRYVTMQNPGNIHLLCQIAPDSANFHYLCVPVSFIQSNISGLHRRKNGDIFLWLSATSSSLFQDEHGSAKLSFTPFVAPCPVPNSAV